MFISLINHFTIPSLLNSKTFTNSIIKKLILSEKKFVSFYATKGAFVYSIRVLKSNERTLRHTCLTVQTVANN